jgi:ribokinase
MPNIPEPVITVVGSANLDLFLRTEKLPAAGETVVANQLARSFGGKGANQAVAIARLGGKARMVCRVGGDDSGHRLIENFAAQGVDTSHVKPDPECSSGTAFVTVDSEGENTIVIHPGANERLLPGDLESAEGDIGNSAVIVTQLEIPIPTVAKAAEIAQKWRVPFILNPAPAPSEDISEVLKKTDVLCPNRTEAERLTGHRVLGVDGAFRAGRELRNRGVHYVVITLGAEGAVLISEDLQEHFRVPEVQVLDSTGAGDAFVGAFAFFFASGESISCAVRLACIAAAISVSKEGTQSGLPTLDEVKELAERV